MFNLERNADELKRLVTDKQRAQEQVVEQDQEEEQVGERDQVEEQVMDQEAEQERTRKRKREMIERTERKVSKHLSVGSLRLMHKDAKTNFKSPIVQLIGKDAPNGFLRSVTLSDGFSVTANVDPLNEEMAVQLDRLPMFAIIEIRSAFVKGDRLTVTDFAFKQVVDDLGEHLQLSKPLTGARVEGLEMLSPKTLELWGIRFPSEVDIVFNARTTTANPDATIMTKDAVIAEVGDANEVDLLPSSPEPKKRKMFQCPSCKPSRSFSDEKKLIEHMDVCHFFD